MFTEKDYQKSYLIPGIPDDIAILCIARVTIRDQGALRFVSKAWFSVFSKGEIYEARKTQGLLQKFLIIFQNKAINLPDNSFPTEFPIMMYDLESQTCQDIRPLDFCGDQIYPKFVSVSSGPDLVFLGDFEGLERSSANYSTHPMWILRGASGRWEENLEGVKKGNRPFAFANMVDGELFVGDADDTDKDGCGLSSLLRPSAGTTSKLILRKFDMQSTWTTLSVPSPSPNRPFNDYGSFVKDNKLYCMRRHALSDTVHVLNQEKAAWEQVELTSSKELIEMGLTATGGHLFGTFLDGQSTEDNGVKVMWYNEARKEFVGLSWLRTKPLAKLFLESLGDRLFLVEVICNFERGLLRNTEIYLSVLKLSFTHNGVSGEWEVEKKLISSNHHFVLSCSVLEL